LKASRVRAERGELVRMVEGSPHVEIVEQSDGHLLLRFTVPGTVIAGGPVTVRPEHHIRVVWPPIEIPGLVAFYEPQEDGGVWFHPNALASEPYACCTNLETQIARQAMTPMWMAVELIYRMLAGSWSAHDGVLNVAAAQWYAAAAARNQLPFTDEPFI